MKIVILKCDRCGKEFQGENEVKLVNNFCSVGIFWEKGFSQMLDYRVSAFRSSGKRQKMIVNWCLECCEKMQVPPPKEPIPVMVDNAPTIEDFIREIVREEVSER